MKIGYAVLEVEMLRAVLTFAVLIVFSVACLGQTGTSDSQTLQALLREVQQIREDIRTTTVGSQRSQILLYRLQDQEAAVSRASQRLDAARASKERVQSEHKLAELNIKQDEDFQNNEENSPAQRKSIESSLAQFKAQLESLQGEEQVVQSREIDAEQKLQAEELRLAELRSELESIDKSLENAAHHVNRAAQ